MLKPMVHRNRRKRRVNPANRNPRAQARVHQARVVPPHPAAVRKKSKKKKKAIKKKRSNKSKDKKTKKGKKSKDKKDKTDRTPGAEKDQKLTAKEEKELGKLRGQIGNKLQPLIASLGKTLKVKEEILKHVPKFAQGNWPMSARSCKKWWTQRKQRTFVLLKV